MNNENFIKDLKTFLPKYETILPVSGQSVEFFPFRVKDAKNLSIIFQENNKKLALKALHEILKNNTELKNLDSLCLADAEYLFLNIRAKSIDEVINIIYQNKKYELNVSEIKCINSISTKIINFGTEMKLELGSPLLSDLLGLQNLEEEDIKKACIKKIIIKNEMYDLKKFLPEELKKLIDNLPLNIIKELDEFVNTQPKLTASIKTEDGSEKEVGGMLDFFIFR